MIDTVELWIVIIGMGLGSFALRFAFTGIVGGRPLPPWVLRHLRYTAVAILPGLVAPLVVWPPATGGSPDLPRMVAAAMTIVVGLITRSVLWAIFAGAIGLYGTTYLM